MLFSTPRTLETYVRKITSQPIKCLPDDYKKTLTREVSIAIGRLEYEAFVVVEIPGMPEPLVYEQGQQLLFSTLIHDDSNMLRLPTAPFTVTVSLFPREFDWRAEAADPVLGDAAQALIRHRIRKHEEADAA